MSSAVMGASGHGGNGATSTSTATSTAAAMGMGVPPSLLPPLHPSLPSAQPQAGLPDLLLDGDRLNMLLDIICTDYITASYASRQNGRKVVDKALHKLRLSVYASAPQLAPPARDAAFQDRCHQFDAHLLSALDERRRHAQRVVQEEEAADADADRLSGRRRYNPHAQASVPVADESLVKETLKPALLQFVEEVCKERDRLVRMEMAVSGSPATLPRGPPPMTAPVTTTSSSSHAASSINGATSSSSSASSPSAPITIATAGAVFQLPTNGPAAPGEIRMEGWLRKKGQHVNLWRDRYFMLRATPQGTHVLCYFRRKGEKEPRGWYVLGPGTTVDEVRESPSKIETKPLFTFRIRHVEHGSEEGTGEEAGGAPTSSSSSSTATSSATSMAAASLLAGTTATSTTTTSTTAHAAMLSLPQATDSSPAGAMDALLSPESSSMVMMDYSEGDARYGSGSSSSARRSGSKRFRGRAAAAAAAATAATAVVLTGGLAGVGIGMGMGMSAAAAASAGAAGAIIVQHRNKGPIALAAESLETANWWRNSIVECIAQAEEQWKRYLNWYMDQDPEYPLQLPHPHGEFQQGHVASPSSSISSLPLIPSSRTATTTESHPSSTSHRPRAGSFGSVPRSIAKTFRNSATFSQQTSWRLYAFSSQLRVDVEHHSLQHTLTARHTASFSVPALRTTLKVRASPRQVFERLMATDSSFYRLNHVIQEAKVLEEHTEDHSDVVYWRLAPTYLWPFNVAARELCLLRYWRKEQDDSYFICFQSTTHNEARTPRKGCVQGSVLGGGFIISPRVHAGEHMDECWVTLTIQMNPKGWLDSSVARSWSYVHAYGAYMLEMITALTAPPDADRTPRPYPLTTAATEPGELKDGARSTVAPYPNDAMASSELRYPVLDVFRTDLSLKNGLPPKFWSEPSATSFLVRGPRYMSTQTKARSTRQAFRLVGVQLLTSPQEMIRHVGLSSFESATLGPEEEDHPLLLIINFMLPGPPSYSVVLYFTPEFPEELKKNSAFADLCHEFMRGASDSFRTSRLKLIPRVVQGTWAIREGVGSTPAILGTKVHHQFYQGRQYLEADYDIGSSAVASGIVKMLLGYAKDLVIDLAFVIEGQSAMELPERVLGCARLDGVDLRHATPFKPV